jgi:peroxiredoxin
LIAALGGSAAVVGAAFGWRLSQPTAQADEAVMAFRALSLPDATGKALAMSDFRGKPLVINFWATWCPPCVEEMPELSELHAQLAPKGLQMLGIAIDSPSKVAEFASKSAISYPLVVAGMSGTELGRQFGNANGMLPFTAVIDRHGRIVQRIPGRVRIESLRTSILELLA